MLQEISEFLFPTKGGHRMPNREKLPRQTKSPNPIFDEIEFTNSVASFPSPPSAPLPSLPSLSGPSNPRKEQVFKEMTVIWNDARKLKQEMTEVVAKNETRSAAVRKKKRANVVKAAELTKLAEERKIEEGRLRAGHPLVMDYIKDNSTLQKMLKERNHFIYDYQKDLTKDDIDTIVDHMAFLIRSLSNRRNE